MNPELLELTDECRECGGIVEGDECEFCNWYDEVFASIPTLFTYDEDKWRYPLLRDLDAEPETNR